MRGMQAKGLPNWAVGVILVVLIAFGSVLAYTKELPWSDKHEVTAVFRSSQALRAKSAVRIAGVNVGKVTELEHVAVAEEDEATSEHQATRVTMEIDESALPLKEDATFKIRPRLFLEGNYFIDVSPGSPSAPEAEEGHTFGLDQTAYSTQLDQILTTLQTDVRAHLQTLLDQFGNSLIKYDGADGLRDLFRSAPEAYRYGAQVYEAQLGTEPHDLSGLIQGLGRVLRGLGRDQQALSDLVTNFRVVSGSFAARDADLGRAIELLPDFLEEGVPAFRELNRALPSLRAFAIEALPGTRTSPETLRAMLPLLQELRGLMSRAELRGLVARLRPAVPQLAKLAKNNRKFFQQTRALSSCFNEVVIPWSHSTVEPVDPADLYPLEPQGRTFENTGYGFVASSSESRSGDGNGQHLRVLGGSGSNLVRIPAGAGRDAAFGLTPFPLLGAMPRVDDSAKTVFRPGVPCETQDPPNLEGGVSPFPADVDQDPVPLAGLDQLSGPGAARLQQIAAGLADLEGVAELRAGGQRSEADRTIAKLQRAVDMLGLHEINVEAAVEAAR
jgi:ABC-type transporter Mla subunit MlaD